MKSQFLRRLLWLFLAFVVIEGGLRFIGFGQIPLYYSSMSYDYALQPNQDVHRFGRQLFVNEEGMRSAPLGNDEIRILKFGDSVLNGGLGTDQSELSSAFLEQKFQTQDPNYRVLNVSAGSWGPDNAFAWMQEHGDFDAKCIVLLFSSHDWQDQIACRDVVGNVPFYPTAQPLLAITDFAVWVWSRFIWSTDWENLPVLQDCAPGRAKHNAGWDNFITYTKANDIPLLVYHHATISEIENGTWNNKGTALEAFLKANQIPVISGLTAGMKAEDYRDKIHPDANGQAKIAKAIYPELLRQIDASK